jgi:hypothetical protein
LGGVVVWVLSQPTFVALYKRRLEGTETVEDVLPILFSDVYVSETHVIIKRGRMDYWGQDLKIGMMRMKKTDAPIRAEETKRPGT